mgnify:FL=1|jgi:hypothetical protein|tara:strand:+ start:1118 stop:1291 length:174 start_codon:yes stop_codon:yes gene_type:complete
MTVSYKFYPNDENGVAKQAIQKTDGDIISSIPFDKANTDYQQYLKWVEKGNTAEAAD